MPVFHARNDRDKARSADQADITRGDVKKAITLGAIGKLGATLLTLALSGLRDLF